MLTCSQEESIFNYTSDLKYACHRHLHCLGHASWPKLQMGIIISFMRSHRLHVWNFDNLDSVRLIMHAFVSMNNIMLEQYFRVCCVADRNAPGLRPPPKLEHRPRPWNIQVALANAGPALAKDDVFLGRLSPRHLISRDQVRSTWPRAGFFTHPPETKYIYTRYETSLLEMARLKCGEIASWDERCGTACSRTAIQQARPYTQERFIFAIVTCPILPGE